MKRKPGTEKYCSISRIIETMQDWDELWQSKAVTAILEVQEEYKKSKEGILKKHGWKIVNG